MPYREPTVKDRVKMYTVIIVFLSIILFGGFVILPKVGLYVWLAILIFMVFLFVSWHAHTTAYRCSKCGHEFEISVINDLLTPHVPHKKYLKCPHCGIRNWMGDLTIIA